jgi:serine/threonine-protein kinase
MADESDGLPQDLTDRRVGDYQVLRKLGQGAMGQVYLARQLSLKRDVALKILRGDHAANPVALQRFQAEAEAVAQLTHPNIVQVFAVGEHDGLQYIALEYVDGRNLRDYLARKGAPELPLALSILRQVAAALQRAGEVGLVHRDVKPENIMITRKAEVKVADFGLSRHFAGGGSSGAESLHLTQSGMTLGTPLYMSPEQVQGLPVDHRSDIYSFGVTAYHLLAGQPPFTGATPFEVALKHVREVAPPLAGLRPDLPAALCAVVHRMMAKSPADRYQTARDAMRDLAKVQKGLSLAPPAAKLSAETAAAPPLSGSATMLPPGGGNSRRAWRAVGAASLLALAGLGWWLPGRAHPPADAMTVGLPDARPPVPVTSARERELIGRTKDRTLKPAEYLTAMVELGVLYTQEHRPDDAEKVFEDLSSDSTGRTETSVAARLGLAIVLAHRDKAKESNQAVADAVAGGSGAAQVVLDKVFFKHPDLGQALAEALHRNAENLGAPKLSKEIEWLRTPGGLRGGRKP